MRCAVGCVALASCIPVSYSTSPSQIRDVAATLRRQGSAVVAVDARDDEPSEDAPTTSRTEVVRLDQPVHVRLRAEPGFVDGPDSVEQTMPIAELLADCPPDLDNNEANRSAYPRCGLFRAGAIQLHHGHRADKWKLALAGTLVAAAGDIACLAECGKPASDVAGDVGIVAVGAVGAAAVLVFVVYEMTKDDAHLKH